MFSMVNGRHAPMDPAEAAAHAAEIAGGQVGQVGTAMAPPAHELAGIVLSVLIAQLAAVIPPDQRIAEFEALVAAAKASEPA